MDKRNKEIVVGSIVFPSHVAAYKHYGINRKTYLSRIEGGWDEEKAMVTPVRRLKR